MPPRSSDTWFAYIHLISIWTIFCRFFRGKENIERGRGKKKENKRMNEIYNRHYKLVKNNLSSTRYIEYVYMNGRVCTEDLRNRCFLCRRTPGCSGKNDDDINNNNSHDDDDSAISEFALNAMVNILRTRSAFVPYWYDYRDILERIAVENESNRREQLNFSRNHDQCPDTPEQRFSGRKIVNMLSWLSLTGRWFSYFEMKIGARIEERFS